MTDIVAMDFNPLEWESDTNMKSHRDDTYCSSKNNLYHQAMQSVDI